MNNILLFIGIWILLIVMFIRYAMWMRYRHPNNQIHGGKNDL